jgi:hypothetical protein
MEGPNRRGVAKKGVRGIFATGCSGQNGGEIGKRQDVSVLPEREWQESRKIEGEEVELSSS